VKWARTSQSEGLAYRGTSLIRNSPPLGPYGRPMPRALWWAFRMSKVPMWGQPPRLQGAYHTELDCGRHRVYRLRGVGVLRLRISDCESGVLGLGFGVSCSGFRILEFGFRVSGSDCRVSGIGLSDFRFRVHFVGFRVSGSVCRVSGIGFSLSGFGYRVPDIGVNLSGFGFRLALEAHQGQMDSFFSQLPYKCHLQEVASMGD